MVDDNTRDEFTDPGVEPDFPETWEVDDDGVVATDDDAPWVEDGPNAPADDAAGIEEESAPLDAEGDEFAQQEAGFDTEADFDDAEPDSGPHDGAPVSRGGESADAEVAGPSKKKAALVAGGAVLGIGALVGGILLVLTPGGGPAEGPRYSQSEMDRIAALNEQSERPDAGRAAPEQAPVEDAAIESEIAAVQAAAEREARRAAEATNARADGQAPAPADGKPGPSAAQPQVEDDASTAGEEPGREPLENPAPDAEQPAPNPAATASRAASAGAENAPSGGGADSRAIEQLTRAVEALQATMESQSSMLDTQQKRLVALGEQVQSMEERIAGVREQAEQAARAVSAGAGETAPVDMEGLADIEKRVATLNERVWTAVANSRIALKAARETGGVSGDEDWRALPDAGQETGQEKTAQANDDASPGEAGGEPVVPGWSITGMAGNQAMVRSPDDKTYLVEPGQKLPGVGRVLRIEPHMQRVVTESGAIPGA